MGTIFLVTFLRSTNTQRDLYFDSMYVGILCYYIITYTKKGWSVANVSMQTQFFIIF